VKVNADEEAWALYQRFVDRFRTLAAPPQRVTPDEVGQAEKALDAYFPASLTQFWLKQGCGAMPGVAAAASVFPRPADAPPPFQRLLSPGEIVAQVKTPRFAFIPAWIYYDEEDYRGVDVERDDAWKYILPIAVDARGRWICMLRHYNVEIDLPVYTFDHQAGAIAEVARGFDDLLQAYLRLPQPR